MLVSLSVCAAQWTNRNPNPKIASRQPVAPLSSLRVPGNVWIGRVAELILYAIPAFVLLLVVELLSFKYARDDDLVC
jgi:hypothetical protein